MPEYTTTNIRLPKDMLQTLKHLAVEEGKSVSQLLRDFIEDRLQVRVRTDEDYENDPFFDLGASGASGQKKGSLEHDRTIYGLKRSRKR